MLKNIKFFLFSLLATITIQFNTPLAGVTGGASMSAYNNFWDGALGGRGYWGRTPQTGANVFNTKFKKGGYKSMYNLNSLSPFAQGQFSGFESMTPYFTPYGASRYTYFPTKSGYLSNDQLGSFAYDINEPRYSELYKQYYKFFNMNLDRLSVLQKYTTLNHDINKDDYRRVSNPKSFEYDHYFDGFKGDESMNGSHLPFVNFKANNHDVDDNLPAFERKLKQSPKKKRRRFKEIEKKLVKKEYDIYNDDREAKVLGGKIMKFENILEGIESDITKESKPNLNEVI